MPAGRRKAERVYTWNSEAVARSNKTGGITLWLASEREPDRLRVLKLSTEDVLRLAEALARVEPLLGPAEKSPEEAHRST